MEDRAYPIQPEYSDKIVCPTLCCQIQHASGQVQERKNSAVNGTTRNKLTQCGSGQEGLLTVTRRNMTNNSICVTNSMFHCCLIDEDSLVRQQQHLNLQVARANFSCCVHVMFACVGSSGTITAVGTRLCQLLAC